jgi:hypothetical protein
VSAGQALGFLGPARGDLLDNPPVGSHRTARLGHRRVLAPLGERRGPLLFLCRPEGDETAHHVAHRGVGGRGDDEIVELAGDAGEGHAVGHRVGGGVDVRGQRGHHRRHPIRTAGDLGGALRLELQQPLGQVADGDACALQHEAEMVGG